MDKITLMDRLEVHRNGRSAWAKGVKQYAFELLDNLNYGEDYSLPMLEKYLLNGARDWHQYSAGGCSLCYDRDIAERLCSELELKKTHGGMLPPNDRENWLQCQARALSQAYLLVAQVMGNE